MNYKVAVCAECNARIYRIVNGTAWATAWFDLQFSVPLDDFTLATKCMDLHTNHRPMREGDSE